METKKLVAMLTVCVLVMGVSVGARSTVSGANATGEVTVPGMEGTKAALGEAIIIDHTTTDITAVPQYWIEEAKRVLHIAYGHTSHGSQVTTGMSGLVGFANGGGKGLALPADIFAWNNGGTGGALDLHDYAMGGDVGYYPQWVDNTRSYLGTPDPVTGRGTNNPDVNVIIWSWCGQASGYTAQQMLDRYLTPMNQLEADYPGITFVYMTGHSDGTGETGNLHMRNQQIRDYCVANNKVLYDFYDIELYNPDGSYYGDKDVNDQCYYDSGSGTRNWAEDWQGSHTEGDDWYSCGCAHSRPLNCNQKAYAAWWMWARLAGWTGAGESTKIASVATATYGEAVTYTVSIQNLTAPITATVYLTDTVPAGLSYVPGTLTATGGTGSAIEGAASDLTWTGMLSPTAAVTVTYVTTVTTSAPQVIAAPALIVVPGYETLTITATITINPYQVWLPLVLRE
jgi:uncharacterized repeat protein (TIGR01451 family)